ncbi:MAG: phosphoribosylaminoimidazolesuccinocarboxamide synthase [SAR324 cluster bacterium]|uniref:Phosphoribosylaminoimidazole-succinocarboxamide synthase n=1 Tax=SAR324 cluster bacterium TaxID=2024889 RepID=A0A7X9IJW7_9DELT|nr:phosphoribosylaminoimidazolesuccinocarboxamide synthase [SAR324 cluster bacterium]
MIDEKLLKDQLPFVLQGCDIPELGECYRGKVRDNYLRNDVRVIITSDRLSCFDVVVTHLPFKGEILNRLALYWFRATENICQNHMIESPDPNVMIVQNCRVLPVEVVVRRYLAGSAWRAYKAGQTVSGITLPQGLREYSRLPELLITPSTKAPKGQHDEAISEKAIIESGLVEEKIWETIRERAFALFRYGEKLAAERGLLLVDTKYEFGLKDDKLILVDEIHTLDSSRYWVASTYEERVAKGESPEMLDKEPARQWLLSIGYSGDGTPPHFSEEKRIELAKHYWSSYERISGLRFLPTVGDPSERIKKNVKKYLNL